MTPDRDDDIAALLPWYLNGTLQREERERVERWLGESPDHQAELAMWRAVQVDVRQAAPTPAFDEVGWRRVQARLPGARRSSFWKVAGAASVLIIAGLQTAILVREPADVHRPLTETPGADQFRIHVRFAQTATMADVRALLDRHDAQLISGPSALGLYTLSVAKHAAQSSPDALLEALEAEAFVLEVTVAP